MSSPLPPPATESARSLWVGVGLLVGLVALAWFFMFMLAAQNPVESVPLEQHQTP